MKKYERPFLIKIFVLQCAFFGLLAKPADNQTFGLIIALILLQSVLLTWENYVCFNVRSGTWFCR